MNLLIYYCSCFYICQLWLPNEFVWIDDYLLQNNAQLPLHADEVGDSLETHSYD